MPDNELLFHYTSQTGLLGILSNQEIWATNIHYLNDYKEFRHCLDLVQTILITELNSNMAIRDEVLEKYNKVCRLSSPNVCMFVTSFSERGDLLSQWRGYCKDSTGYSIGFKKHVLQHMAIDAGFTLQECVYDTATQMTELTTHVKTIFNYNKVDKSNIATLNIEGTVSNLFQAALIIAPRFKDQAFSEEKEWRLISPVIDFMDGSVEFRQGKSSLIPYIKFSLIPANSNKIPISKIYVGPTPDPELAKLAVTNLLYKLRALSKRVELSKVPFKNW